jgi:hypothetical protein
VFASLGELDALAIVVKTPSIARLILDLFSVSSTLLLLLINYEPSLTPRRRGISNLPLRAHVFSHP